MNGSRQALLADSQKSQRDPYGADVLTQGSICARLGISDETWRRWRARGITPPRVELPGHPRWRVIDIEAFLCGRRWRNSEGHAAKCVPLRGVPERDGRSR